MAVIRNARQHMSPILLVGAASVSIVVGVSALRYASATAPQDASSHTLSTEIKATSTTEPATNEQDATDPSQASPENTTNESSAYSTTSQQTPPAASQGSVTVNGQTYTVPGNGELHTTTNDANGQTSVNISVQSSGTGQNYSSSSTSSNVQVFSNSFNMSQSTGSSTP